MSDGLQIPEHLWKALELMEEEMGVPKNNLVCQAIFTLARLNGYMVAGQVSFPLAPVAPAPPTIAGREEVLEAPALPRRDRMFEAPRTREAPPPEELSSLLLSQNTSPRHVSSSREEALSKRRPTTTPPYAKAEAPTAPEEHEYPPEEAQAHGDYEAEAEFEPLMLYIEIPGEPPVPMEGDEFIIGRGKSCNFVIDSNRVSRQHARIIRDGDCFVLEDLNSSNGTFYGKHREKVTRRIIVDRDEFIFGTERVTFLIQ